MDCVKQIRDILECGTRNVECGMEEANSRDNQETKKEEIGRHQCGLRSMKSATRRPDDAEERRQLRLWNAQFGLRIWIGTALAKKYRLMLSIFPLSCMEITTVPVALLFLYLFHPPTRSAGK